MLLFGKHCLFDNMGDLFSLLESTHCRSHYFRGGLACGNFIISAYRISLQKNEMELFLVASYMNSFTCHVLYMANLMS